MPEIIPLSGPDASILAEIRTLKQQVKDLSNRNPFTGTNINMTTDGHLTVNGLQLSSISPASVGLSQSAFAVSTTPTVVCSTTVTVPPGYKTALVMAVCMLSALNTTAAGTTILSQALINGSPGAGTGVLIPPSEEITLTPAAIRSMDVSSLSSFTVDVNVWANAALPSAGGSNLATVNAIVTFVA